MEMYYLIEYSDNYLDTSGTLWHFKRDDVTKADSSSFKYKSSFLKPPASADNGVFKNVKIAVPLNI